MILVRRYYNETLSEEYNVISARYGDKTADGKQVEDKDTIIFQAEKQGSVCVSKKDFPKFFDDVFSCGVKIAPAVLEEIADPQ